MHDFLEECEKKGHMFPVDIKIKSQRNTLKKHWHDDDDDDNDDDAHDDDDVTCHVYVWLCCFCCDQW